MDELVACLVGESDLLDGTDSIGVFACKLGERYFDFVLRDLVTLCGQTWISYFAAGISRSEYTLSAHISCSVRHALQALTSSLFGSTSGLAPFASSPSSDMLDVPDGSAGLTKVCYLGDCLRSNVRLLCQKSRNERFFSVFCHSQR